MANFLPPPSFSAFDWGDPFRISKQSFTDPKTRVFAAVHGENVVILALRYVDTVPECDRRTDRRLNDG